MIYCSMIDMDVLDTPRLHHPVHIWVGNVERYQWQQVPPTRTSLIHAAVSELSSAESELELVALAVAFAVRC